MAVAFCSAIRANPTDAEIAAAIARGQSTPTKKLWAEIKKAHEVRLNRGSFGNRVAKKVVFISDLDRVALESAEAARELREVSVSGIKTQMNFGVTDVLLEATVSSSALIGELNTWSARGGVHMVLKIGGATIQPIGKAAGPSEAVSIMPQEHGLVTSNGPLVTYTPLYRSAWYERDSLGTWFTFPELRDTQKGITVIVISGTGDRRDKEIENPL